MLRVSCSVSQPREPDQSMERWESDYQHYCNGYPRTASHVRYPYPVNQGDNETPSSTPSGNKHDGGVFTSATEHEEQSRTSSAPVRLESESQLSPPDSPLSLEDPQVCLSSTLMWNSTALICAESRKC